MIVKTYELRDRATFIPVLAVKLEPGCEADRYLLGRAGYGVTPERQAEFVLMAGLDGGADRAAGHYDEWPSDTRTRPVAHKYITEHFDELPSGSVIDVEHILGESAAPKESERLTARF